MNVNADWPLCISDVQGLFWDLHQLCVDWSTQLLAWSPDERRLVVNTSL